MQWEGTEICVTDQVLGHALPVRTQFSAHLPPLGAAHVGSPLLSAEALPAPGVQRQRLAAATATCGVRGASWQLWQRDLGVYQQHARGHQRLEAARLKQIRQLSGLAQSVALPILWRELSLCPFYHAWFIRAACFWNALASTQGFHKQIALDAVMLALHRHVRNWVHGLRHSLSVVGYNMHLDPAAMHNIDISELRICLSANLAHVWNNLAPNPRVCPSVGARLCTYLRWFAQPTNNKADLVRLPLPRKAMVSF